MDHADQLRALYCVNRKSRKWWHRLFFGMIDIAFVNAYSVYCQIFEKVSVKEFRRSVAVGLMTMSKEVVGKRSGSSGSFNVNAASTSNSRNQRGASSYSVPKDIRLGNRGCHWLAFTKRRGRCESCSLKNIQSRPYSTCSTCKVYLCSNEKKNCFADYHEVVPK